MNIVFDLGGVVFTWEPEAIITSVFTEPEVRARVRAEIFGHADWCELDRGTLPLKEAIIRAAARTGLAVSTVADLMRQIPLALVAIPDTVDLLYRLKAKGHRLFYLSNMHVAVIEHLVRTNTFWDIFEGGIISCHVHLIKPEPALYNALFEKYALDEGQTIFIDDTEVNIAAAAQLGVQTIRFENPAQCKQVLKTLGVV